MSIAQQSVEGGRISEASKATEVPGARAKGTRAKKKDLLEKGGGFGVRIKAAYMGKVKHKSDFLPPGFIAANIFGKSGSGKSCLVREILPSIANLCSVLVCTSKTNDPVYEGIQDWCESTPIEVGEEDESEKEHAKKEMERRRGRGFSEEAAPAPQAYVPVPFSAAGVVPDTRRFVPGSLAQPADVFPAGPTKPLSAAPAGEGEEEMIRYDEAHTLEEAMYYRALHRANRKPGCFWLVVFDDWCPARAPVTNKLVAFQNDCASKLRGDHAHVISVSQAPVMTSNITRNSCTVLAFFRMVDGTGKRMAAQIFSSLTSRPEEAFLELYDMICRVEHAYVFVASGGMNGRVFINLPDGKHDGMIEVFPKTEVNEETIIGDEKIQQMAETIINLSASSSPMARYQLGRATTALHDYAVYLSTRTNTAVGVIEDLIHEAFHLGGKAPSATEEEKPKRVRKRKTIPTEGGEAPQ